MHAGKEYCLLQNMSARREDKAKQSKNGHVILF